MINEKKYSNQFKISAVNLITELGYNVAEVARSLGVHDGILRPWKKQLDSDQSGEFPGNGKTISEKEGLIKRRKAVKRLKMENEISKKNATTFFAKESM